jgi:hypothetical protein
MGKGSGYYHKGRHPWRAGWQERATLLQGLTFEKLFEKLFIFKAV